MTLRLAASFLIALFSFSPLAFVSSCATAQEMEETNPPRIVAVGDLHGDYEAYEEIMLNAGLIDRRGRWRGGDAVVVQTGDIADRGPDSVKIIRHLQKLEKTARRKGGRVITLVGNHEAMNITGDLRYVHPGEYEAFTTRKSQELRRRVYENNREAFEAFYLAEDPTMSPEAMEAKWIAQTPLGQIEHQSAWRPEGEIGAWVIENPAVVIVGENLFVHGGVSWKYAGYSIDALNANVREALAARTRDPNAIINDAFGPLWYRRFTDEPARAAVAHNREGAGEGSAGASPPTPEQEIERVLEAFGAARMIVGHTPSLSGVRARLGGKVIQIDTGASAFYGGTRSFLEIRGDALRANDDGVYRALQVSGAAQGGEP